MVTITKHGQVPDPKISATCRNCKTEFTFVAEEAHYNHDQRDGDFYSIVCPLPGSISVTGMIENPGEWKSFMRMIQDAHQAAADEDGGMHIAGVEILLAYENGATVDDCMMRMFV